MDSSSSRQRTYFPGLNGLRFLAALAVIICHIEEFRGYFESSYTLANPFLLNSGNKGVTIFFTLSGFLITYLLLTEKTKTGSVHIQRFYIRRLLRIWPLYFLMITLSFFVLPYILPIGSHKITHYTHFSEKLTLYIAFFPHVANISYPLVLYAWHLWSIGVEEHFYLLWPFAPRVKNFYKLLLWILVVIILFKVFLKAYPLLGDAHSIITILRDYFFYFRIECFAVGGLFAYIYFQAPQKLVPFRKKWVIATCCIIMVSIIWFSLVLPFSDLIFSLLSGIIIINVISMQERNLLEHPLLSYLGRISYGIYMFHPITIGASFLFAYEPKTANFALQNTLIYILSIGGTIAMASLSYHLFETRFLKLKNRFNSPT